MVNRRMQVGDFAPIGREYSPGAKIVRSHDQRSTGQVHGKTLILLHQRTHFRQPLGMDFVNVDVFRHPVQMKTVVVNQSR